MYRIKNSRFSVLGGVFTGIGHQIGVSRLVLRVLFVICMCLQPFMVLAYVALWLFMPVRYLSDSEVEADNITFRDLPSVKNAIEETPVNDVEQPDSPKVRSSVLKDIESSIEENNKKV